ncbi:hypothetical protein KDK_55940 [Dictyobacter kobayashii]|uniref:Uncharacterized protein n=1 Tax=Dictyobacter kobayashii TaxID=2014872 RepID=A0A402ARR8_9CHLR|nr:hypothetical protein KDK_55940 [Dictyobacter kobayashii]
MRQFNTMNKENDMLKDNSQRILLNEESKHRDRGARRRWKDKPDGAHTV